MKQREGKSEQTNYRESRSLSGELAPRIEKTVKVGRVGPGRVELALSRYALLSLLVLMIIIYSLLMPGKFSTYANFRTILSTQSVLSILALGMLLPMVVGQFDVSAAANLGLSAVLVTALPSFWGQGIVVAIVVSLVVSTLVGLINGLLITSVGVNSLITTLGMSILLSGVIFAITMGQPIYTNIPDSLITIGRHDVLGLPLPVYYLAFITLALWYMLEQTPVGRYMYAIGGSKETARMVGIKANGLTLLTYVICGFLAGWGGIVTSGRVGAGSPAIGPPLLFPAFAAAFLGAAAIKPGTFNVLGTIIAVFTIAVGVIGLQFLGVPYWVEYLFNGAALILGVTVVRYLRKEAL